MLTNMNLKSYCDEFTLARIGLVFLIAVLLVNEAVETLRGHELHAHIAERIQTNMMSTITVSGFNSSVVALASVQSQTGTTRVWFPPIS